MAGLMGNKPNAAGTPHYTHLQLQTSAEGVCIPILYGRNRVAPNLINAYNFRSQTHKAGKGGKGGGKGGATQTTYKVGVTMALCEGPVLSIGKIWKDTNTTTAAALGFTLYAGSDTQAAYRRTAYVDSPDYDLGVSATMSQHNFEVTGHFSGTVVGTPDVCPANVIMDLLTNPQYGLGLPDSAIGDLSVYAAYCIAQGLSFSPLLDAQEQVLSILQRWAQLTNSWFFWSGTQFKVVPLGDSALSFIVSGVYDSALNNTGSGYLPGDTLTLSGAGNGDATVRVDAVNEDSEAGALGFIRGYTILSVGGGYVTTSNVASSGGSGTGATFDVFVPAGASYTPVTTPIYALTYEDFIGGPDEVPVTVTRSDPADAPNWVKLEISARDKDYNASTIEYKDQTSIDQFGLMQAQSVQAKEVCARQAGVIMTNLIGKRATFIRNTYAFKLGYNFVLLEPGDIVSLSEPALGLSNFPVRIRSVEEDETGVLAVTAEECPALIGTAALYATQTWTGTLPPAATVDPGSVNYPAIIEPPNTITQGIEQIWFGLSGGPYWGGAQVWASVDDVSYIELGVVGSATPQGVLRSPLAAHADPDSADTLAVDLSESRGLLSSAVTPSDADAGRTLCLVGGELIGYGTVAPGTGGSFDYDLTYLRRGYGATTAIAAHAAGDPFAAILPSSVLRVDLPRQYIGQTIYLKFPSFNIYGNALQDISSVVRYSYTPTGAGLIPPVTGGTSSLPLVNGDLPVGIVADSAGVPVYVVQA